MALAPIKDIKAGESIKLRARRGMIPVNFWNPMLISDRKVPPGLSETVKATLWEKSGDHEAVIPVPEGVMLADALEIVTVKGGMVELYKGQPAVPAPTIDGHPHPDGARFQQLRPIHGIVSREDESGHRIDYIVLPGFYIIENDCDGVVWALSPHHVRAWFVSEE